MQDRPSMEELLQAVTCFLDEDVVPHLDGSRQFYCRVAANALRTVMRELDHEEAQLSAEWERLNTLLSKEAQPSSRIALKQELRQRTEALCERIRRGDADAGPYRTQVLAHVRESVKEKLQVSNPGWLRRPAAA
ncbi:MAG: hypothetical protein HYZ50_14850 [Deltaproteobacteria bacterium]|nr:hypothetical protein [Deltaproteobacteria bacterium]